jgi:cyclohexanone monooxygenase
MRSRPHAKAVFVAEPRIAGFPNAFMVLGPNLAIGHNSAFLVIEAQLDYIAGALCTARREGLTRIEVRRDAQAIYNRRVQRALATTVWNTGGCSSYYLDANGKNSTTFPWSTARMQQILARFDLENYPATGARPARTTHPARSTPAPALEGAAHG